MLETQSLPHLYATSSRGRDFSRIVNAVLPCPFLPSLPSYSSCPPLRPTGSQWPQTDRQTCCALLLESREEKGKGEMQAANNSPPVCHSKGQLFKQAPGQHRGQTKPEAVSGDGSSDSQYFTPMSGALAQSFVQKG